MISAVKRNLRPFLFATAFVEARKIYQFAIVRYVDRIRGQILELSIAILILLLSGLSANLART